MQKQCYVTVSVGANLFKSKQQQIFPNRIGITISCEQSHLIAAYRGITIALL